MLKRILLLLVVSATTLGATIRTEPSVLARIGDKTLTSMDVKKRMDFIFQHQYPQYAKNTQARFEFYKNSWRDVVQDMVQTEMILAHVAMQEEKIKQKIVSDSDVHRELHERFGPDVIASLSNIGMTYEEACGMLRREMQVGNMVYVSVQDKVKKRLRPEEVRRRYTKLIDNMRNKKSWRYQVVTIDAESESDRLAAAGLTEQILSREGLNSLATLNEKAQTAASIQLISQENEKPPTFKISVSSTIETGEDDIDPLRLKILSGLQKGEHSEPFSQVQRKSKKSVQQILVLHSTIETQPPSFQTAQEQIQAEIGSEIYQEEMNRFMGQLRERFPVEILFTQSDEPFKLT